MNTITLKSTEIITEKDTPITYRSLNTVNLYNKTTREYKYVSMEKVNELSVEYNLPIDDDADFYDNFNNILKRAFPDFSYTGFQGYEQENTISLLNDKITIYKSTTRFGEYIKSTIKWSAIGSTSPDKTKEFAMALLEAVEICKKFDELDNNK